MSTTKDALPSHPVTFEKFTASTQASLFEDLKQSRFSGKLVLTDSEARWIFYLYLGRIVYATGGIHTVRRWRRNLVTHFPQLSANASALQTDLNQLAQNKNIICWEYHLLCLWGKQKKATLQQVSPMIRATLVEILFDLNQATYVTCELQHNLPLSTRLVLIDAEPVIAEANQLWQAWQLAKLTELSPNHSAIITQPEQLQQRTSPRAYQTLSQLLNGQQTLRDVAIRMKRDVLTVTRSLIPYIQLGLIKLKSVPDLSAPVSVATEEPSQEQPLNPTKTATIACVDDSPLVCQNLEKIIGEAGYQFLGVQDPLRALSILLSRRPDLVFLDLVMPNANGYEICSQLRRVSSFKDTPIIILTGNDGIVDRVRAKMVGASDFISKPVKPETLLETIQKYLS